MSKFDIEEISEYNNVTSDLSCEQEDIVNDILIMLADINLALHGIDGNGYGDIKYESEHRVDELEEFYNEHISLLGEPFCTAKSFFTGEFPYDMIRIIASDEELYSREMIDLFVKKLNKKGKE